MLTEILEMPLVANEALNLPNVNLPLNVPYLGMGSSYFAPLCFKYMGVPIHPELASEYEAYLAKEIQPLAVIISQSGRSSEAVWCTKLFREYVGITNDVKSPLATAENIQINLDMAAGEEKFSSSKTYINTLLVLFKGFGLDPVETVVLLTKSMSKYEQLGRDIADRIFRLLRSGKIHGIYITGSGPNIGTAMQAALIMSESTKLSFTGLPMAQYDHGPKETAANSIVIQIVARGKNFKRSEDLGHKIAGAGAHVFTVEGQEADERFSVLHNIIPFNFMAYYLSKHLNVADTFVVGGKVTEVNDLI